MSASNDIPPYVFSVLGQFDPTQYHIPPKHPLLDFLKDPYRTVNLTEGKAISALTQEISGGPTTLQVLADFLRSASTESPDLAKAVEDETTRMDKERLMIGREVEKTKKASESANRRRAMVTVFEMEYCLLFPRTSDYLMKLPEMPNREEEERKWRHEILWMTAKGTEATLEFVSEFSDVYRSEPRLRFNQLLGLSIWFEMRPKHFLRHVHLFTGLLQSVRNDGNLLVKHVIAILRAADRNLKFVKLPLDAVRPDFFIQYDATMDFRARHVESDALLIENKFTGSVTDAWRPVEYSVEYAACLLIAFSFAWSSHSLEVFAVNDRPPPADGADLFDQIPLIAETARRDEVFASVLSRIRWLRDDGTSEFQKFEVFAEATRGIVDALLHPESARGPARKDDWVRITNSGSIQEALAKRTDTFFPKASKLQTKFDDLRSLMKNEGEVMSTPLREPAQVNIKDTEKAQLLLESVDQDYKEIGGIAAPWPFRDFREKIDPWLLRSCFWVIGKEMGDIRRGRI
jgi:hypothetical protein